MTERRKPVVYPSAIDRWLVLVILAGPLFATANGGYMFWIGRPGDASMMFFIAAFALAIPILFMVPCRYTLLDDTLSIRCGLVFYQLSLADITNVTKSATLLSGPALSLKRVEIETSQRSYIVSPQDRDQFIADLQHAIEETKTHCSPSPSPPPKS